MAVVRLLLAGEDDFRRELSPTLSPYQLQHVRDAVEAAEALSGRVFRPEAVIVDFRAGSAVGPAVCHRVKGAAATLLLPVIALVDPRAPSIVAAL